MFYVESNSLNFSAGADLSYITENLQEDRLDQIRSFIELGQKAVMRMKYAKINVVSCASGVALGGGCELLLHSSMLIAHSNLNAGLVELKVGLVPGWGGIKEMLIRSEGDTDKLIKTVSNIILSNKSSSADYFIDNYYIQNYKVVPNKYKMLQYLCDVELPKKTHNEPDIVKIPSIKLDRYLNLNHCDDFQKHVLYEVQKIIDFGDAYEYDLLKSEREIFMNLVKGVKF
jgi:3-hydroxyacyl-CoA dehydrogenase/enoyl-CoA hydratase/3-hydroxybutyryl-CoA epimerase